MNVTGLTWGLSVLSRDAADKHGSEKIGQVFAGIGAGEECACKEAKLVLLVLSIGIGDGAQIIVACAGHD